MRVPVYDQQENPAPLPAEHVGLENVGAGSEALAQGVNQLSQGAMAVGGEVQKYRQQAADLEVTHAHIALAKVRDQVLHGTTAEAQEATQASTMPAGPPGTPGSPATGPAAVQGAAASVGGPDAAAIPTEGVLNSRGLKGVYASQPALQYLDKARDAIASKLSTPYAQKKFRAESEESLLAVHTAVEQHAAQQMQEAKQAGLQDFMAVSINFAANNYTQPGQISQQTAAVDKKIAELSNSPEEAEAATMAFHQHVHEAVLNQFIANKDFQGAQAYLATSKQDLGAASAHFGAVVQTGIEKQQGDTTALKLAHDATDPVSGLVNTPKLIGSVNALPEAQRTEALKQSAHSQLQLADASNVALAAGHFNTALSAYNKRNSLADISAADQTWLEQNDAKGWLTLKGIAARDQRAAAAGPKGPSAEESLQYSKGMEAIRQAKPEDVPAPENISHDYAHLPVPMVQKLQDFARQRRGEKPPSDHGLPADQRDILMQGMRGFFNMGPGDKTPLDRWTPDHAAAYTAAENAVIENRATYRAAHKGAEPSPELVKNWTDGELVKVTLTGTGGLLSDDQQISLAQYRSDPAYRGKAATVEGRIPSGHFYSSDQHVSIPADKYEEIRARVFKSTGQEPTPEQARGIFNALPKAAPAPAAVPKAQLDLVHPTNRLVLGDQPDFTPAPAPRAKLKAPEKTPSKSAPLAGAQAELDKTLSNADTNQGGP